MIFKPILLTWIRIIDFLLECRLQVCAFSFCDITISIYNWIAGYSQPSNNSGHLKG
jgi:hypothetical protein